MSEWKYPSKQCCARWLVLPTVYYDALSYGEQLDKFCYALNQVIENNNFLPTYVQQMIQEYISSGAIGEVVRDIIGQFILNVKYPPEGITPAVGDGSADDTEAIQGCIDYAAEHNGMAVYFPSGSYLTKSLTIRNRTAMFGFDRYSTHVVLRGGATAPLLSGTADEISITGITLDGNMDIQVNNIDLVSITVGSALISNAVLTDGYTLLKSEITQNLQINNVIFDNAVVNGIELTGSGKAQVNNAIFNHLSQLNGYAYVILNVSDSILDNIHLNGDFLNGFIINGKNNVIRASTENSTNDFTDNGINNNIIIYNKTLKETFSGNVNMTVSGNTEYATKNASSTINGNENKNVSGNLVENISGMLESTINGDYNKTVGGNSTFECAGNNTVNVSLDETKTISGNKTETVGGADIKTVTGYFEEEIDGYYTVNSNGDASYSHNSVTFNSKHGTSLIDEEKTLIKAKDIELSGYVTITDNWYNALSYGFKNDGITDNLDAFNDFITNHNNCTLFMPEGNYIVNGFINVNKHINIVGKNAVIIPTLSKGDVLTPILEFDYDCYVEGITIDGTNIGDNSWSETNVDNLHLISGMLFNGNAVIKNCTFKNFWGDGLFAQGQHTEIYNCYFNVGGKWPQNDGNDKFGDAIYIKANAKYVNIHDCTLDMLFNNNINSRAGIVCEFIDTNETSLILTNTKIIHANRGIHIENTVKTKISLNGCIFENCDAQVFNWTNTNTTRLVAQNTNFYPTGRNYNGQYGFNQLCGVFENCYIGETTSPLRDLENAIFINCKFIVADSLIIHGVQSFYNCEFDCNNIYNDFSYDAKTNLYNCKIYSDTIKYVSNTGIFYCYDTDITLVVFLKIKGIRSTLTVNSGDNYNYSVGSQTFTLTAGEDVFLPNLLFTMPYNPNYTGYEAIQINLNDANPINFKDRLPKVNKNAVYVCLVIGADTTNIASRGTLGGYWFKVTTDNNYNLTGSTAEHDIRGSYFDLTVDGEAFTITKGVYTTVAWVLLLPYHYLYDSGLI